MPNALRILALSVSVTAIIAKSTVATGAADFAGELPSIARASAPHWRARPFRSVYPRHAPTELIAGVRGASPLTVPFFGSGWYPGPAYYYGPTGFCCRHGGGTVISVRY